MVTLIGILLEAIHTQGFRYQSAFFIQVLCPSAGVDSFEEMQYHLSVSIRKIKKKLSCWKACATPITEMGRRNVYLSAGQH